MLAGEVVVTMKIGDRVVVIAPGHSWEPKVGHTGRVTCVSTPGRTDVQFDCDYNHVSVRTCRLALAPTEADDLRAENERLRGLLERARRVDSIKGVFDAYFRADIDAALAGKEGK